MVYLAWLAILLSPYWLGPIVVWLTQKIGANPVFEPFTPGRHAVPTTSPRRSARPATRSPRKGSAWSPIGPDSIVAWLRALERDHPFVLTGVGFDWLAGRFVSAIRDADALARRLYAFCPDVVDQGTETVAALAQELRQSQRLYCWWD